MRRFLILLSGIVACSMLTYGQESIWEKIERKAKEKSEQKQEEAVDEGLNAAEEGAKDAAKSATTKKEKKGKKAKEVTEEEQSEEAAEAEESDEEKSEAAAPAKKSEKLSFASYSKLDFVPGDKIIMFEDFSQDAVGDFPAKWNTSSSGEVVTVNSAPGKWLKMTGTTSYLAPVSSPLPDNFTVEYDVIYPGSDGGVELDVQLISKWTGDESVDALVPAAGGEAFRLTPHSVSAWNWIEGSYGKVNSSKDNTVLTQSGGTPVHVSFWIQKERLRVYVRELKVFDLPKANPTKLVYNALRVNCVTTEEDPVYFSNLRIAVGAPDMRNKLLTEGKFVTRGITFDSGSDEIRPDSYGTLKSIAEAIKEGGTIKVKIIGHTDSDGTPAGNLELSKRRAAAVKNSLAKEFGIDAARLTTDGKGQTEPASPNTSSEGKANNRRVEFVKM